MKLRFDSKGKDNWNKCEIALAVAYKLKQSFSIKLFWRYFEQQRTQALENKNFKQCISKL